MVKPRKKLCRAMRRAISIATDSGAAQPLKRRRTEAPALAVESSRSSGVSSAKVVGSLTAEVLAKLHDLNRKVLAPHVKRIALAFAGAAACREEGKALPSGCSHVSRIIADRSTDRSLGIAIGAVDALRRVPALQVLVLSPGEDSAEGVAEHVSSLGVTPFVYGCQQKQPAPQPPTGGHIAIATVRAAAQAARDSTFGQYSIVCVDSPPTEEQVSSSPARGSTNSQDFYVIARAIAIHGFSCVVVAPNSDCATSCVMEPLMTLAPPQASEAPVGIKEPLSCSQKTVTYVCCSGVFRFQALFSLLHGSAATNKIVVRFSTPQTALYIAKALYALNVPFRVICDAEQVPAAAGNSDKLLAAAQASALQFDAESQGCVLLTCLESVPCRGTVFVQYDPPVATLQKLGTLVEQLRSGNAAAYTTTPVVAAVGREHHVTVSEPATSYKHIVLFLRSTEEKLALSCLYSGMCLASSNAQQGAPQPPSPHVQSCCNFRMLMLVTSSPSRSCDRLNKKLFVLANCAFEGYRAFVDFYAHLQPRDVFEVRSLNLNEVAEEFGLEEPPLLDLRTEDNTYRPKQDFVKAAKKRERMVERKTRAKFRDAPAIAE